VKNQPLISVITIVYNGALCLEKTILSVASQVYGNVEYIVVDGGSTDGTLEIIERFNDYIDIFKSESDNGISDAFNKGIRMSGGDWILLLNCGDVFATNYVLSQFVDFMGDDDDILVGVANTEVGFRPLNSKIQLMSEFRKCMFNHQSALVSSAVYAQYGVYDETFKLRMDYDFFCRVIRDVKIKIVPVISVSYEAGGASSQDFLLFWFEGLKVIIKNKKVRSQFVEYLFSMTINVLKKFLR
jgi:glycosyltransferase involved in cell wall biosynthesis